jgi:hypothetical protein
MRIFIVGAIVLVVFAIIATAATTGELFGVTWYTWLAASLLSFYVDLLTGWAWAVGPFVRRDRGQPVA